MWSVMPISNQQMPREACHVPKGVMYFEIISPACRASQPRTRLKQSAFRAQKRARAENAIHASQ